MEEDGFVIKRATSFIIYKLFIGIRMLCDLFSFMKRAQASACDVRSVAI